MTDATRSIAQVKSDRASIYLQQLCKHFQHKLPVEFTPENGSIAFSIGVCRLAAAGDVLTMTCEAASPDALPQLQDVVARHLARFAFREPPEVVWRAVDAG